MSQPYTIKAVNVGNEWESKKFKKRYQGYSLDLEDANGVVDFSVESNRQIKDDGTHNEPKVGEQIIATIKDDGKLQLDYDAMKEQGGGGSEYPAKAEHKAQAARGDDNLGARIERQAIIKALGPKLSQTDSLTAAQKQHIEEIETFVNAANRAGGSPAQAGSAPPSDASPSSGSQDQGQEHQWFKRLLEAAHMDPEPAHVLAEFIVTKFDQEKKVRAESGLEDSGSQMETVAKLKKAYEDFEMKSLPDGPTGEPDIPFARPEYRQVFDERMRWRF